MELGYYLFKNRIKIKDFAFRVGVVPYHMTKIIQKRVTPSLVTALKIHEETDGEVSFREMVREKDLAE